MSDKGLFRRQGEIFTPTPLAAGPWDPGLLHGGSTAGLLAFALESALNPEQRFARLTCELFRPVPMTELRLETRVIRNGRRAGVVEAWIYADSTPVARGVGLSVRREAEFEIPAAAAAPLAPPEPQLTGESLGGWDQVPFAGGEAGLAAAIEVRLLSRMDFSGAGEAWIRFTGAVVIDAPLSPFVYAATLSDFGNGFGQLVLANGTGFINADITMHLLEDPAPGSWLRIQAQTTVGSHGAGFTQSRFFQERLCASVTQVVTPQRLIG